MTPKPAPAPATVMSGQPPLTIESDPLSEFQAGYNMARRMYGDSYADYLIRHDQELITKDRTVRPWPLSLQGNDGD
jgi:hypothetical protein